MKVYETEQRRQLVALLKSDPDRFFTADELAKALCGDKTQSAGSICSVSTVYRLIGRLCEEGIVQKLAREGSRKFYYRYMRGEDCGEHLHLKCDTCGKIIHVDDSTSTQVLYEVLRNSGFSIDGSRTMMPGTCNDCRSAPEKKDSGSGFFDGITVEVHP